MALYLRFIFQNKKYTFLLKEGEPFYVGRGSKADVKLQDTMVSNLHAEIILGKDGFVKVKDLNSTNGTEINGKLIDKETKKLYLQDSLKIGNAVFHIDEKRNETSTLIHLSPKEKTEIKQKKKRKAGDVDFDNVMDISKTSIDTSSLALSEDVKPVNEVVVAPDKDIPISERLKILREKGKKVS
ncbi:FHA domain-containing protein [Bacteriovoracaceae bacterium]|nr:FHA domain-containing protein [Bacteriovoracaceae bacterium]